MKYYRKCDDRKVRLCFFFRDALFYLLFYNLREYKHYATFA